MRLGWYIGVLATEYKLLENAKQPTDAVMHELYLALMAFERLDAIAEKRFSKNAEDCRIDGFFVRDNVSNDFAFEYMRRQNWIPSKDAYINAAGSRDFTDRHPFYKSGYIENEKEVVWQKPTGDYMSKDHISHMLLGMALVKRSFENKEYSFLDENGNTINFNFHSHVINKADQILSNFKVYYGDDIAPALSKAPYDNPLEAISEAIGDILSKFQDKLKDYAKSIGDFSDVHIVAPNGKSLANHLANVNGEKSTDGYRLYHFELWGWAEMANYFSSSSSSTQYLKSAAQRNTTFNFMMWHAVPVGYDLGISPSPWTISIVLNVAAIGNSWTKPKNFTDCQACGLGMLAIPFGWAAAPYCVYVCGVDRECNDSGIPNPTHWTNVTMEVMDKFAKKDGMKMMMYPLLTKYLHQGAKTSDACKEYTVNTGISASEYLADLSTAPCDGTKYMYGADPSVSDFGGTPGWRHSNRFEKYNDAVYGPNRDNNPGDPWAQGEVSGLDYMLYHNLYRLCFEPNSASKPILAELVDNRQYNTENIVKAENTIVSASKIIVSSSQVEVPKPKNNTSPGNTGGGGSNVPANPPTKSTDPVRLDATDSNVVMISKPKEKENPDEDIEYETKTVINTGNVTYKASKNIKLTNGFMVKKGASFAGKIEKGTLETSYTCSKYAPDENFDFEIEGLAVIDINSKHHKDGTYSISSYDQLKYKYGYFPIKYTVSPNPFKTQTSGVYTQNVYPLTLYGNSVKTGYYKIQVEVSNGRKTVIKEKYIAILDNSSVRKLDEYNGDILFELYPNPTNGELKIVTNFSGEVNISVSDIYSRTVKNFYINTSKSNIIAITDLPSGVYYIQVQNDLFSKKLKIVKE